MTFLFPILSFFLLCESLFSSQKFSIIFCFWDDQQWLGRRTESHQMKIYLFSPSFHFFLFLCLSSRKFFDINIHNKHQHQPTNRQLNRNKIEKVYVLLCFIYSFRVISLRFLSLFDSNFHSSLVLLP